MFAFASEMNACKVRLSVIPIVEPPIAVVV